MDSTENVGASAATASVEEVGEALQSAMLEAVLADDPSPEVTERVNSEAIKSAIADVVSITNDMTDTQRGFNRIGTCRCRFRFQEQNRHFAK